MNAVLVLIEAALPAFSGNAALIQKIIDALIALYPMIAAEYADLKPIVVNIVTALRGDASTTTAQLTALDTMEAQLDADYETAAAAATAEDAAAKPTS